MQQILKRKGQTDWEFHSQFLGGAGGPGGQPTPAEGEWAKGGESEAL